MPFVREEEQQRTDPSRREDTPAVATASHEAHDHLFSMHHGLLAMDALSFAERLQKARELDAVLESFGTSSSESEAEGEWNEWGGTASSHLCEKLKRNVGAVPLLSKREGIPCQCVAAADDAASSASTRLGTASDAPCGATAEASESGDARTLTRSPARRLVPLLHRTALSPPRSSAETSSCSWLSVHHSVALPIDLSGGGPSPHSEREPVDPNPLERTPLLGSVRAASNTSVASYAY